MVRNACSAIGMVTALVLSSTVGAVQAPTDRGDIPRIRVGVDAVRIDAVVTDRENRVVEDLTANDFVIKQDGKPQPVTFAQFMPVAVRSAASADAGPPASPAMAPIAAPVTRNQVQRTIVIVVDDLSLSFRSIYDTRRGLRAFVERGLQPTDLVALVRTGQSTGAMQSFTTDRRVLYAAIDGLRWNGFSRNGVESFAAAAPMLTNSQYSDLSPNDFQAVNQLRNSMSAAGSVGALNLAIRGARDLPGRKAIILVTEGFELFVKEEHTAGKQVDSRVRSALDRIIDQATRAGVVIYALDSRGLSTGGLVAEDQFESNATTQKLSGMVRNAAEERAEQLRDSQEGMAYLAEQTGGFAVRNTNDLSRGLTRITSDIRGYYVIGYTPETGTFAGQGKKPQYRKLTIDVKRPGLKIRTRKEFLGVSDPEYRPTTLTPAQQLVHAATSPFAATDVGLKATVLPGYSKARGMFVRSLLHIDTRALTFTPGEDGRKTASADVLGMVFNQEGAEVGLLSTGFSVALTNADADEAQREGLAYVLSLPIKRPGGYQVRFAIRDRQSGVLGSAGEFVQVDDVAGGAFALSGILLRKGDRANGSGFGSSEQLSIAPEQALSVFRPGDRLSYAYEVYNAAKVQTVVSLWRGTERVFAAPPDALQRPANETTSFAAAGGLGLGEQLTPGSYVLQVLATADAGPKKTRSTIQRVAFDIEPR
jgi:VWFA-related protein